MRILSKCMIVYMEQKVPVTEYYITLITQKRVHIRINTDRFSAGTISGAINACKSFFTNGSVDGILYRLDRKSRRISPVATPALVCIEQIDEIYRFTRCRNHDIYETTDFTEIVSGLRGALK